MSNSPDAATPAEQLPTPAARTAGDGNGEVTAAEFPVVGIGASAGGLSAFAKFLSSVQVDSGMAFVFVQHLAPHYESQLAQILAKESPLPVFEASDGMVIHPDHVYVIPPNTNMALAQGRLRMTPRVETNGAPQSIDHFMRSLAHDHASRAIGVVLSGTGVDGTMGMAAIKAGGGITFAQEPKSAEHGEMPASAISHGCTDYVLTPQEIAQELAAISRHPYLRSDAVRQDAEAFPSDDSYAGILAILKGASDIDFSLYRTSTIKRRILRRMALRGSTTPADYLAALTGDAQEKTALLKDVLITVTSFFRDRATFDALRELVFPALVQTGDAADAFRIWVVACATGQEAYSLAIELTEFFDGTPGHPRIQIFATDISDGSLATARTGVYPVSIASEVSPERLRRHFTRVNDGYRVNKTIRDMCVFARHDITADTPFSNIDLITCRNVLIYLTPALQARVIPIFHYTLRDGGILVLGNSETVGRSLDLFDPVDVKNRVYVKKPSPTRIHPPMFSSQRRLVPNTWLNTREPSRADLQRAADRIVLGRYAPAGVLVDEGLNIIQFRSKASSFLEPAQGEASLSLLKMVPFGLGQELKQAIAESKQLGVSVRRTSVRLRDDQRLRAIDFEISLVRLPGSAETSILILFEESAPKASATAPATATRTVEELPDAGDYARVKQELTAANDYLQALSEENNAVNDELRFANDEAVSSNEELRCTNEELQTAKEEVESANEELVTLNEELNQRNHDLTHLSDDLTNLLDAIDLPIVMLGRDLRIRRVTRAAEKTMRLTGVDIGRLVGGHDLGFPQQELAVIASEVMSTRKATDLEVKDRDGRWCSLRITPYRTEGDGVDGAVVTCIDIDAVKRTQEMLSRSGEFTKAIIETVRDPLLVLDADLRIHTANRAFLRVFGLTAETTIGMQIHGLGGGEWDIPELRRLLTALLSGSSAMDDFAVTHDFGHLGKRTMLLNARLLEETAPGASMIVLVIADVTAQKHLNDELTRASLDLRRSNADLDQFASIASHDLQEPLRTITSYTELLQRRLGDKLDERSRGFMDFVITGATRMRDLIQAILEYSRVGHQALKAVPVDATVLAQAALAGLERSIHEAGATIVCAALPCVVADPVLLTELFQNLVSNAIKFRVADRPSRVTIAGSQAGEEWLFSIADNGIGIRPADTERIFDLFQRLNATSQYSGTGIGLATCRRIVERHGGRLWVESTHGVGTTFHFSLPVR